MSTHRGKREGSTGRRQRGSTHRGKREGSTGRRTKEEGSEGGRHRHKTERSFVLFMFCP